MPRVVVITGARRGIGRFLAQRYLDQGDHVYGCSRSDSDLKHDRYQHTCLDVADEQPVKDFLYMIGTQQGGVDVLLNNAGIASMNHAVLTPLATVQRIFATNVMGVFLFSREAAKKMRSRAYGRIVNFTSVATALDLEGESAYAASKASVESLTRIMARELAPMNITVNAVGPTPIATDLIGGVPQSKIDALTARQAIKRMGTVTDVGNVVDFFLREDSGFITGQTIYLGGVR